MERRKELLQIGGPIILEESDSGKEILNAEEHAENLPTNPCGNSYAGLRCDRVGVARQRWREYSPLLSQRSQKPGHRRRQAASN